MERTFIGIFLGLTLGLAAQVVSAATVYKWVDENGTVHYGERPPEGVEAVAVSVDGSPPKNAEDVYADARSEAAAARSVAAESQQERDKLFEEQSVREEQLAQRCAAERELLTKLMPSPRVIVQDEDGTIRRLDDNERLGRIDEAQRFIDENCADY